MVGKIPVRKEISGKTKDNMKTGSTEGQKNVKNRGGASNGWNEMEEDHSKSTKRI